LRFRAAVICRIQSRRQDDRVVVHLAGHLTEAQVPDLLEACGETGAPPLLELDELLSADTVGMDALLRIKQQGAGLVGLPEYLQLKLETLARERRASAVGTKNSRK
jgi:hypothetical protein